MNVFESQINHALKGIVGPDVDSRPSSPSESAFGSPRSRMTTLRGSRPTTRDSVSVLSRFDGESTISVLGAARTGPPTAFKSIRSRPGTGTSLGGERMEHISARIASIQAKVSVITIARAAYLTRSSRWR